MVGICPSVSFPLAAAVGRCTSAHLLLLFTELTSPEAALLREPRSCNAEMSITVLNFPDQKTETQKGNVNYPRSGFPMVLQFIKLRTGLH